jgi:hypothetical protein
MLLHVMKRRKAKKAPGSSSSSEEEEYEEEYDEEEDDQVSTSSFEDEEIIQHVGKVMRVIHKINLMGVSLQVEDLFFNIDRKKPRNRGCCACGEKGRFRDNCPNTTRSLVSKLRKIPQVKMNLQGVTTIALHLALHARHTKCLIASGNTSILSSSDSDSDDEDKPPVDELAYAAKFFKDIFTKQKTQLKVVKSKFLSSQMIIKF